MIGGKNMSTGMIHHIELYVSNLEQSVAFWAWLLETLGYSWDIGKSWQLEDNYLVFVQVDDAFQDKTYHRRGVGLNHLAFHAASRQQVDDLTSALRERGITILYEDRHPFAGGDQHYAVFFEDPDRIKVELVAPPV